MKNSKMNMTAAIYAAKDPILKHYQDSLVNFDAMLSMCKRDSAYVSDIYDPVRALEGYLASPEKFYENCQSSDGKKSNVDIEMQEISTYVKGFRDPFMGGLVNELKDTLVHLTKITDGKQKQKFFAEFKDKLQTLHDKVDANGMKTLVALTAQERETREAKDKTEELIKERLSVLGFKVDKEGNVKDLRTFKARFAEAGKTLKKAFTGGKNPEKGRMHYLRRGLQKLSKGGGRSK